MNYLQHESLIIWDSDGQNINHDSMTYGFFLVNGIVMDET
jgi:hypothetical protein